MTNDNSLKKRTITNLIWRFLERFGAQFVAFVVTLVLARILSPADYGLIALVSIVINILNVFVDSGLGNALIQKKESDEIDFSTVFWANLFFCIILYILLFFVSPLIAKFYKSNEITPVIRVLGLTLIISGVKNIQQAYVSKHLIFKKFFFSTLIGTILAAFVGIFLALHNFGIWALVAQQLTNLFIDTLILWITVPWKPTFTFSINSLRRLFSYGWKLLLAQLIHTIYLDIRQFVIGKVYSPTDLAFYNQGKKIPSFIGTNLNFSIESVIFPVMALKQNDIEKLKYMTRMTIMTSSYIMWPILLGIAAISRNLVELILTDKWLPCLPYLVIACFEFGLEPLQTSNLNAIKALGRSDISLKLEIIKKLISTSIILITMPFGVFAIAMGSAIYCIIATMLNSYPNRKLINYPYLQQVKDSFPSFFLAVIMALIVYFIPLSNFRIIIKIFIQIFVGAFIYISGSIFFKFQSFYLIKKIIHDLMSKKEENNDKI